MALFSRSRAPQSDAAPTPPRSRRTRKASTADQPQFVTHQELDAALEAIGLAIGETFEAARDSYANPGRFCARLEQISKRSTPGVRPFLARLTSAIHGHRSESYGVDRNKLHTSARQSWDTY